MAAAPAIDLSKHPLTRWSGTQGLPDFTAFSEEDFAAVFDAAMTAHNGEIDAITSNAEAATLENTLGPLELAGDALSRTGSIFWLRAGAHTNDAIQKLERELAPKMSKHYSAIGMNAALFARIDALWKKRDALKLDGETRRVLEESWKGFVRSGAKLDEKGKARLSEINQRLASLGTQFGQNVLKDETDWVLFLEEEKDLAGLPDFLRAAMKAVASERGKDGAYAVTLSRSIIEPFLTFSENRDLREKAFRAWAARGENEGETNNIAIVAETLKLRAEKAKLLGYDSYAALKLDNSMAKTPKAVRGLLDPVWEKARERAAEEQAELQRIAAESGSNHAIEAWDWRHFAEKLRQKKFAFDEAELKPYLQLENIIAACFDVATRLFGLSFEERKGVPLWHEDARLWIVRDRDGSQRGLFAADYFARSSKRSGAWMSSLQEQHGLGGGQTPIIYNIMNFARPPSGEPALLSMDDARTLFHEFGHALHGLMSKVKWPSVAGTSVPRDWVELPSQLYEHWLTVPATLQKFALHAKTNKPMPQALIDKVLAAKTFNAGFNTVEFTASALVDMEYHSSGSAPADPMKMEAETLARLNMPDAIVMRHRTPHFQHVFAGDGYSAGYYSYMWSEVLDADAFAAFEETGDPFNPELASKLLAHVYAVGGSADPEKLYTAFRGRMPTPDAMMKDRGLV